jgi:hypothetical protein
MLFVNPKYKPIITKPSEKTEPEYNTNITPNIQGKGLNELIEKVKDMKVKELNKKRKLNSNEKISFN